MTNDYVIAGHRIRVEGKPLVEALQNLSGFAPFRCEPEGEPVCVFRHADEETGISTPVINDGKPLAVPSIYRLLYHVNEDIADSSFGTDSQGNYVLGMLSPSGQSIRLVVDKSLKTATFCGDYRRELIVFATWLAYGLAVLPYKTLAIHSSTIVYRDKAVLFLGESGTGKSTHTRLWRENIPEAHLLNDDCPIIRIMPDGSVRAFGSAWSGKTPCYINASYPLLACVRLSQAPYNRIKRLSVSESFAALHPSCPPNFAYADNLYDMECDTLSDMLSAVPVYAMEALPDADAARLVRDTLFGS